MSIVFGLVTTGLERGYDATQAKLTELDRSAEISTDLDDIETVFQRSLQTAIRDRDLPESEALAETVDSSWETVVHEAYGIEGGAETPDAFDEPEYERFLFKNERDAVRQIVDAWTFVAGIDTDDPHIKRELREIVSTAYSDAFGLFTDNIRGTDLADVFTLETLREVQHRLDDLRAEHRQLKVYKSLAEFEQVALFGDERQSYVPPSGERIQAGFKQEEMEYVENAQREVCRLLADGVDIVTVYGEGGVGKSQLLAAVGAELLDTDEKAVRYVTDDAAVAPLPTQTDTVLFVDDAGRKDVDWFIRRAVGAERGDSESTRTVQVVAAARSQYKQSVEEVVTEYPRLRHTGLRLNTLSPSEVRDVLTAFPLGEAETDHITQTADGNPFFAVLLAQSLTGGGAPNRNLTAAFDQVVDRMVSTDIGATEMETSTTLRRFLTALAVWQDYTEPADEALLTDFVPAGSQFRTSIARKDVLDRLVRQSYLDQRETDDARTTMYGLQYDLVADYLRFEAISEGMYRAYARPAVDEKAPAIATGLSDLIMSPLRAFYPTVEDDEVSAHAEWLGKAVFDRDLALPTVFETKARLALVSTDHAEDERLNQLFDPAAIPPETASSLANDLLLMIAALEGTGQSTALQARLSHLETLHERYSDEGLHEQLAVGVVGAINHHAHTGALEEMGDRIAQLETLTETHTSRFMRDILASAKMTAVYGYGQAGALDRLATQLAELESLAETQDTHSLRTTYAQGLFNAVNQLAKLGAFERMRDRLDQLESLADTHDDEQVQHVFARSLRDMTSVHADSTSFTRMDARVEQLASLYEAHPDRAVREQFAVGLRNAIHRLGQAGNVEAMTNRLDQLRTLFETHPDRVVRRELAVSISDAIDAYARAPANEETVSRLHELEALQETYPDQVIHDQYARGLTVVIASHLDDADYETASPYLDQYHDFITQQEEIFSFRHDDSTVYHRREFVETSQHIAEQLLAADVEQAKRYLTATRAGVDGSVWERIYDGVVLTADQRLARGTLSTAAYREVTALHTEP